MPAFVIIPAGLIDGPIDGVLCDPSIAGGPDRRTDTPVKVTLTEKTLTIDEGPPRRILSNVGESGRAVLLIEVGNVMEGRPWV